MADPWSPPPTAQQFQRAEQPGLGQILARLAEVERQTSEMRSSLLKRSGISVTPDGLVVSSSMASWDYDGTSPTNLGTKGWYLGPDAANDSRLVLNGIDVYADLSAKAAYQASLISRDDSVGFFNTGPLINDSAYHLIGDQAVISNVAVPTGKVRVTISCSEAWFDPGANAVIASVCFAIDGQWSLDPTQRYARFYTYGHPGGMSLTRVGTETLTPGTYTFRAQAAYWSSGSESVSINFSGLRLLVEVIGAD